MLRHFLATLAYRGSNILREMPLDVPAFRPDESVRSPIEILNHINGVLTFAHAQLVPCDSTRPPLVEWDAEVRRFYAVLRALDQSLRDDTVGGNDLAERLLQGPFADAMLHLGQIGIFRRMAGSPVESENYFQAEISAGDLRDAT